jgi:hypothetical protein
VIGAEESSAIYPGLEPPPVPAADEGWQKTGWHSVVQPAAGEQPANGSFAPLPPDAWNGSLIPADRPPSYPQINHPLDPRRVQSPPVRSNLENPNPDAAYPMADDACPDCGIPIHQQQGFAARVIKPIGKLIHVFTPEQWLHGDPELVAKREPWNYRPFSASLFMGPIFGSTLIDNTVTQGTGFLAGARFGYDFDDDWGLETRIGSATFPVGGDYPNDGMQHSSDHFIWDIDFLYYPWGDSAVRPYFMMGVGVSRVKFGDTMGYENARILAGMPFGVGVKWKFSDWFIFRLECLDNVAFAGGSVIHTQHNASLSFGFEVRFGRPHVQYWPWNPGMRQF